MITAIEIENFKAFGERQRIELRPITLLFGPNSGGKSSISHALHLLREIMVNRNIDATVCQSAGSALDLGGFARYVHGRQASKAEVVLAVEIDVPRNGFSVSPYEGGAPDREDGLIPEGDIASVFTAVKKATLRLRIGGGERPRIQSFDVDINGERLAVVQSRARVPYSEITNINWTHPLFLDQEELAEYKEALERQRARQDEEEHQPIAGTGEEDEIALEEELSEVNAEMEREDNRQTEGEDDAGFDIEGEDEEGLSEDDAVPRLYDADQGETEYDERVLLEEPPGLLADLWHDAAGGSGMPSVIAVDSFENGIPEWRRPLKVHFPNPLPEGDQERFAAILSAAVLGPGLLAQRALADLRYIGPLRTVPSRAEQRTGVHLGLSRWASGLAAWEQLADGSDELVKEVSDWLESDERLDTGYRLEREYFKEVPDHFVGLLLDPENSDRLDDLKGLITALPRHTRIVLRDVRRNLLLQPQDVGVGLSQVVPVVAALVDDLAPLVLLEQPELHLHPRQQAALGDVVIRAIQHAVRRRVIIETHSEHLILRLLRRIRETAEADSSGTSETDLQPDEVAVVYIQSKGTNAVVSSIDISDEGDFKQPWPNGFFAERVKELL